jgi:hypothetical protein
VERCAERDIEGTAGEYVDAIRLVKNATGWLPVGAGRGDGCVEPRIHPYPLQGDMSDQGAHCLEALEDSMSTYAGGGPFLGQERVVGTNWRSTAGLINLLLRGETTQHTNLHIQELIFVTDSAWSCTHVVTGGISTGLMPISPADVGTSAAIRSPLTAGASVVLANVNKIKSRIALTANRRIECMMLTQSRRKFERKPWRT